jgi:hypothetical protein
MKPNNLVFYKTKLFNKLLYKKEERNNRKSENLKKLNSLKIKIILTIRRKEKIKNQSFYNY